LTVEAFDRIRSGGIHILDTRSPEAFSAHIPGALNAGVGPASDLGGTVLPFGEPYLLVVERSKNLWEVCWNLLRIDMACRWAGLQAGCLSGVPMACRSQRCPNGRFGTLKMRWSGKRAVRSRCPSTGEWAAGHIDSAIHIPGAEAPDRLDDIPRDRPVAVICGSGYRSSAVASLLKNRDTAKCTMSSVEWVHGKSPDLKR